MSIRQGKYIIASGDGSSGGTGNPDDLTIKVNENNQLEAVGTLESNKRGVVYDWVGTTAEYTAQQIESLHPDWLCFITDDYVEGVSFPDQVGHDGEYLSTDGKNIKWGVVDLSTKADKTELSNYLPLTGGSLNGNLWANCVVSTWFQTTAVGNAASNTGKIAVIDGQGWIYYRTPEQLKEDIGVSSIPDYSAGIDHSGAEYTAPSDGVVYARVDTTTANPVRIYINAVFVADVNRYGYANSSVKVGPFQLAKGDVIKGTNFYTFFPMKGAK